MDLTHVLQYGAEYWSWIWSIPRRASLILSLQIFFRVMLNCELKFVSRIFSHKCYQFFLSSFGLPYHSLHPGPRVGVASKSSEVRIWKCCSIKFLAVLINRIYYELILRWALIAGTLLSTLFLTTSLVFDVSSLTDIQNARGLIEVLSEMLSALTPQDRMVCFLSPGFLSLATMCSFSYLLISIVEILEFFYTFMVDLLHGYWICPEVNIIQCFVAICTFSMYFE